MRDTKRMLRRVGALLFCIMMTVHVLQSAAVASSEPFWLVVAERVWPNHPRVLSASVYHGVGAASARRQPLGADTVSQLTELAKRDGLAVEPFLILGASAYKAGDRKRAEQLLLEARRRDPRSPAARYLLAALYLDSARVDQALQEAAVLARLVPRSAGQLSPALAQYLDTPTGLQQIYRLLKKNPEQALPLLNVLAADPKNADVAVGLSGTAAPGSLTRRWQQKLIGRLMNAQDYAKAWSVWARLNGREPIRTSIYDANFRDNSSSPPFNWELSQEGAIVERQNGALHVLYFGQEPISLARQVLLLSPGLYHFRADLAGDIKGSQGVSWKVLCLPSRREIFRWTMETKNRVQSGTLAVPGEACKAQELRLEAEPGDFPATSDFQIRGLSLVPRSST